MPRIVAGGMRGAHHVPPEHALGEHVGGEGELAPDLRYAIGPGRRSRRVGPAGYRVWRSSLARLLHSPYGREDPAVAGAAAQVARDGLANLQLGGVGIALEQVVHADHEPGRAEAALHAAFGKKRGLDVGELVLAGGQPLDRHDVRTDSARREHHA